MDGMLEKALIKCLIKETSEGNFRDVHQKIERKQLNLRCEDAINIIVACCRYLCFKKDPFNSAFEDIKILLKLMLKYIKDPSTKFDEYLRSIYHIVKVLLDKNCFTIVLQLEDVIVPNFVPTKLTAKQENVFEALSILFYNSIIKIHESNKKDYSNIVLRLNYFIYEIWKRAGTNPRICIHILKGFHTLEYLETPSKDFTNFYLEVLKNFDQSSLGITKDSYMVLMGCFQIIYTYLFKKKQYDCADHVCQASAMKIKELEGEDSALLKIFEVVQWHNPNTTNVNFPATACAMFLNWSKSNIPEKVQPVCELISNVAYYIAFNSENIKCDEEYCKFLYNVYRVVLKKSLPNSCLFANNLDLALKILGTLFAVLQVADTLSIYREFIPKVIDKYTLHILETKGLKCDHCKISWYHSGQLLYNLSRNAINNNDYLGIVGMKSLLKIILHLEDLSEMDVKKKNMLKCTLKAIYGFYSMNSEIEKYLFYLALYILLINEDLNVIIQFYIKAKYKFTENEKISQHSLVSVLEKFKNEISFDISELLHKSKMDLLIFELKSYKKFWSSKVPMMTIFREIVKIADPLFAGGIFIDIWCDCTRGVHEQIPKLLTELIANIEKTYSQKGVNVKIVLAYLYFFSHRYKVENMIIQTCVEMEKHEVVDGVNTDPNDKCDITSTYECLNLKKYLKIMKNLDKSFEIVLSLNLESSLDDKHRLYQLFEMIAHEYCLHNQIVKSLQSWELALKVARLLNNKLYVLKAITFIVEWSDLMNDVPTNLVQEGEEIIRSLEEDEEVIRSLEEGEICGLFYLSKAEAYLHHNYDVAYESFERALKIVEKFPAHIHLTTRFHLVHHKFITLPCKYATNGHEEFSTVKLHMARNACVKYSSQGNKFRSWEMRIIFEIGESLGKMYSNLHLPRDVRCYLREPVLLAQKMVLPLRVANLLYYLAEADLYNCRIDDCRVKISGLFDILNLPKSKKSLKSPLLRHKEVISETTIDSLVRGFEEMILDLPVQKSRDYSPGSSPKLCEETFQMPDFTTHEDNCDCFCCLSVQFQVAVLRSIYLQAVLNEHEGNEEVAKDFLFGGQKLLEFLNSKQKARNMSKKLSPNLLPVSKDSILDVYYSILLKSGQIALRNHGLILAKKFNNMLLEELEKNNILKHGYFYDVALQQSFCILLLDEQIKVKIPIKHTLNVETTDNDNQKTPENKTSKILVTYTAETRPQTPKRIIKKIQFDLSDNEEEKPHMSKCSPKNLPPFLFSANKTPAPTTSIKVYQRKKKPVLTNISPPKNEQVSNGKRSDLFVLMSPDAYTPNSKKVDTIMKNNLDSKTQLLTKALQKSTKKVPAIVIDGDTEDAENACNSRIAQGTKSKEVRSVKKNLLSRMNSIEKTEKNVEPRRSKRNKK